MLVLTRRPGEEIMIGADIKITVLRISSRAACIGIAAPKEIGIVRQEIAGIVRRNGQSEMPCCNSVRAGRP